MVICPNMKVECVKPLCRNVGLGDCDICRPYIYGMYHTYRFCSLKLPSADGSDWYCFILIIDFTDNGIFPTL